MYGSCEQNDMLSYYLCYCYYTCITITITYIAVIISLKCVFEIPFGSLPKKQSLTV